jgi:sigma-E factor negative regulatory protein RseC
LIEEVAKVIAINATQITVESTIKSACSGCQQVDQCGSGQVAKAIPQKRLCATLTSALALNVGDDVLLGISEQALLTSAWQVYFLPLLGLILWSAAGQWLMLNHGVHELFALALGILGGYLGFRLASFWQHKCAMQHAIQPIIVKVLPKSITVAEIE